MRHDAASPQPALPNLSGRPAVEKVKELLGQFQTAMMVTPSGEHLRVRPMAPNGNAEAFDGTLWFFTDERSRRIREIAEHRPVSLIFQDDRAGLYLHLIGRTLAADRSDPPQDLPAPTFPYLSLLRFEADRGYFWESPGGMLRALSAFTKTPTNGSAPHKGDAGSMTT